MDKKRAERQFNWQAIREAVERMRPELIAASEAAHKAKEAELDEAEPELDRTLELGYLVDCLGGTCGPHLAVLSEIARALDELHDEGSDRMREKKCLRIRQSHRCWRSSCAMAQACNGNGQLQWPARVREVIENIEPVNAPSCYRISLLSTSLGVTARLKSVDDLDLLMNVSDSLAEINSALIALRMDIDSSE